MLNQLAHLIHILHTYLDKETIKLACLVYCIPMIYTCTTTVYVNKMSLYSNSSSTIGIV